MNCAQSWLVYNNDYYTAMKLMKHSVFVNIHKPFMNGAYKNSRKNECHKTVYSSDNEHITTTYNNLDKYYKHVRTDT